MSYNNLKKVQNMPYNDLKKVLDEYNWDDGFDIPKEILRNQNCDLALALEIFYLGDGYAYFIGAADEVGPEQEEWKQFISALYNDILCGKYPKTSRQYEIPLNKVQKYKFRKNSVPEIFLDM